MNKDDVLHLAELAKLELTDAEVALFPGQLDSILEFVGKIKDVEITTDVKRDFGVMNVFRNDENPHESGENRAEILHEMPETKGDMLVVKKILSSK